MSLADYVEGVAEGRRGVLVQRQKDRSVWRVEEDGRVWFAKRGVTPKRRREIRREAENLRAAGAAGVAVPSVLSEGLHGGAHWLVTRACRGLPILEALARAKDDEDRGCDIMGVAFAIASLHEKGFAWRDLVAEHVFVGRDGGEFVDLARIERYRGPVPMPIRARDLAAFLFSVPSSAMSEGDRRYLVREATDLAGDDLETALDQLEYEHTRLRARTRWRHGYVDAFPDVIAALRSLRGAEPLPLFDAFLDPAGMEILRTLPDRQNRRFGDFFAKYYPPVRRGVSPAMRECDAIGDFQSEGIPVCEVAAYGEDVDRGSFVVVRRAPGRPLDDVLRGGVSNAERRDLVRLTAGLWRKLREAGLRHRDAYPCHVLAARIDTTGPVPGAGTGPRHDLCFIDMTRAGPATFPRERWFVKDAAALWHGCPRPPVTRTDAVRWLREYFRIGRLDARAKRFARRVAAKERRIAARQARKRCG